MTAEAVCERLCRRQFEEGQDIFAVQWSSIHRMAQTGDMRGLRCVGLAVTGTCAGTYRAIICTKHVGTMPHNIHCDRFRIPEVCMHRYYHISTVPES